MKEVEAAQEDLSAEDSVGLPNSSGGGEFKAEDGLTRCCLEPFCLCFKALGLANVAWGSKLGIFSMVFNGFQWFSMVFMTEEI